MRVLYYEENNPDRKMISEFDDIMYNSMLKDIIFTNSCGKVTVYAHVTERKHKFPLHYPNLDYNDVLRILLVNGYIDLTKETIRDSVYTDRYYYNNLDIQAVYNR